MNLDYFNFSAFYLEAKVIEILKYISHFCETKHSQGQGIITYFYENICLENRSSSSHTRVLCEKRVLTTCKTLI